MHPADDSLLNMPLSGIHRRLAAMDWDFPEARADEGIHGLVPYPAKFLPDIPRRLIRGLSRPGDVVLDPFGGCGTTAWEAVAAQRAAVSVDASPWASLITKVKLAGLRAEDLASLKSYLVWVSTIPISHLIQSGAPGPAIPNLEKWYDIRVFGMLAKIRQRIYEIPETRARDLALLVFAEAASRASFQESDTRYVSKLRPIDVDDVRWRIARQTAWAIEVLSGADSSLATQQASCALTADARGLRQLTDEVGLVVTSPPYPNAYDYHLYQRFRILWIGGDPSELRRLEIGSHLRHQGKSDLIETYRGEMRQVLSDVYRLLRPGRFCALVVGDGLVGGILFRTSDELADIAAEIGFAAVQTIARRLPNRRRSMRVGRRLAVEQILVLQKPAVVAHVSFVPPNYRTHEYERVLLGREIHGLASVYAERQDGSLAVDQRHVACLVSLAFVHGFAADGRQARTHQWQLEGEPAPSTAKKNSNYLSHGIHRFKGKFYPQLARALINASALSRGSVVVDPFGGSGTTALEAALLGHIGVSIDSSPMATAIARAKLEALLIPRNELVDAVDRVCEAANTAVREDPPLAEANPRLRREIESWFAPAVVAKLERLLGSIAREDDERARSVLRVLASDLVREVSQQEPRDLRIRRRVTPLTDAPVFELFEDRARDLLRRTASSHALVNEVALSQARVICDDSSAPSAYDLVDRMGRGIDAVVTSPPYAAALPYLDTDRLSLATVLGLDSGSRVRLEGQLIGSREIRERERTTEEAWLLNGAETCLPASTIAFLSDYLDAVRSDSAAGFRLRNAPAVFIRYFRSMAAVMNQLATRVVTGGTLWFVVGDSTSTVGGRRRVVPTVMELAAIGERAGLRVAGITPIEVSREDVLHSRNSITKNQIIEFIRTQPHPKRRPPPDRPPLGICDVIRPSAARAPGEPGG